MVDSVQFGRRDGRVSPFAIPGMEVLLNLLQVTVGEPSLVVVGRGTSFVYVETAAVTRSVYMVEVSPHKRVMGVVYVISE